MKPSGIFCTVAIGMVAAFLVTQHYFHPSVGTAPTLGTTNFGETVGAGTGASLFK